jgi:hypothetical protein
MTKKKSQRKSGKKQVRKIGQVKSDEFARKLLSAQIMETPARAKLRDKIGEEELKRIESGLANLN